MTQGRLAGRVALVTGGGEGIGRSIVRRLVADGAAVVVAEINPDLGRQVEEEFGNRVRFVQTDVMQRDQVEAAVQAAVDTFGSIDILVNNAWGGGSTSRVEYKTDAQMDRGLAMGFRGPLWAMQAAFPHMKAAGWGRIINMVSLNGVNAHIGTLEYNTAKEALRTLTRTAAREWAPTGVVVNAVAPGARSAAFERMLSNFPELEKASSDANPMGRVGDPDTDIAPVVAFLASDDARYLTGNTLFVDGGSHINGVAWQPNLPDGPV